jgi:hypothetical protein
MANSFKALGKMESNEEIEKLFFKKKTFQKLVKHCKNCTDLQKVTKLSQH